MEYIGKHRKTGDIPFGTVDHIAELLLPIGWDTQEPVIYRDATFHELPRELRGLTDMIKVRK